MKDSKLLLNIANAASESYLTNKIDMNDFITKEAQANSLTDEEIQRIVEFANTKTYLELRKTAELNYVDFDVADASKIERPKANEKQEVGRIHPQMHSDYKTPPMRKAAELEKQASAVEPKSLEKRAQEFSHIEVPVFEKTLYEYQIKIAEDQVALDDKVNILSNKVRQLLLSGGKVSDVKSMFMLVDSSGKVWEQISNNLAEEFPLTKTAEIKDEPLILNTDNSLVKMASDTSILLGRLVTESLAYEMIKAAYVEERNGIKEAAIDKMHPVVKGGLAAVLTGTVYGLGSKHATAKAEQEKLDYYNKLKPERRLM